MATPRNGEPRPRQRAARSGPSTTTTPRRTSTATRPPARTTRKAAPPPPLPPERGSPYGLLARWAAFLLLLGLALSAGLGFGAFTRSHADARVDLLADPGSAAYQQQARFADTFGGDPVVVMAQAKGNAPLLTANHFVSFFQLEAKLRSAHGVYQVYGPGSIVNTFAYFVTQRALVLCENEGKKAEAAARQDAINKHQSASQQQSAADAAFAAAVKACAQTLAAQFPSTNRPALNNPDFIRAVILNDDGKTLRPYWNFALPDTTHVLITARMKRDASLNDVRNVERIIKDDYRRDGNLSDVQLVTTGSPVLTLSLADAALPPVHNLGDLWGAIANRTLLGLLPLTLIAMAVVTLVVLRVSYRLFAVPLALLAALWAAGVAGWISLPVTPATLAVLPVVLGLATDYSLQAANRLSEEAGEPAERVTAVARAILPPTVVAAIATALGVLAFALSPIPLVRQFAYFMAIGVAMAWLVSVVIGLPLFTLAMRFLPRRGAAPAPPSWAWLARAGRLPVAAVAVLVLLGIPGWIALNHLKVETDPTHLMPQSDPAVQNAQRVQKAVGLGGEVDLVLEVQNGGDVSSQQALQWLAQADKTVPQNSHGGLSTVSSLPAFLEGLNRGSLPDDKRTKQILQQVPGYFTGAVVSADHHTARTPFALRGLNSVEQDKQLVNDINALPPPPAGYHAYPAGLAVVAANALTQLTGQQLELNALALLVVLVVLTLAYRHPLPAALAVLPTAVAAGWVTGVIFLLRISSSPITVLLAGVVVAFATEFSVLWLSRYRSELRSGAPVEAASEVASRRIGPAVIASALALVVGFGALALSPVPMVRDFGIWSALDLALATAAVLVLLPPLARRLLTRDVRLV